MPDELKQLRGRIDALDQEILKLVGERAATAHAIGKLKGDGPVYRPEREAQVLRQLAERNPGPLPDQAVMPLFTAWSGNGPGLRSASCLSTWASRSGR